MGLDNGIIIRGKTAKGINFLTRFHENYGGFSEDAYSGPGVYEIIYLRKCWNIRYKALSLGLLNDCCDDDGDRVLSITELNDVVDLFKYFLVEKNWQEDGDSIWQWHTILPHLAEAIRDIRYFLQEYEDEDFDLSEEDFEITFYDSY